MKGKIMSKVNYNAIATEILKYVGGKQNVTGVNNCITRLRLTIKEFEKVDIEKIKKIDKVNAVVIKGTLQIVFDMGVVDYVRASFDNVYSGKKTNNTELKKTKINFKDIKLSTIKDLKLFTRFLGTIQGTFGPILPVLVGLGILMAGGSLLAQAGVNVIPPGANPNDHIDFLPLYLVTNFAKIVFDNLGILVGFTAAKYFKGNPIYGMAFGIFVLFGLPDPILGPGLEIGVISLTKGMGGVLGIMAGTYVLCMLEK
jgi:PTS system sucrose-specific IIC component